MGERFVFPLNIQLPYMEATEKNMDFVDVLKLLQAEGFSGVELNITDFSDPAPLQRLLAKYRLKLSMVASGAFAVRNSLALSATDEAVRVRTVAEMKKILAFAKEFGAGVICGFIKGTANLDKAVATAQLQKSIAALADAPAPLYLEATNHYEATLVNTIAEGVAFIDGVGENLHVLPDTYHMNIEETGIAQALVRYAGVYRNLHLSDNNRYFPGFGAINFREVYGVLRAMGYTGATAVEGRVLRSPRDDIMATAAYLEDCSKGLRQWNR